MTWWTINAVGLNGHTYPIYLETETLEQAEHIVDLVGIIPDEAGVCEFIEVVMDERYS